MIYNSIIIGGGPAGVTAAMYIRRRNIDDVMIIDTFKDSALLTASYIDNYYGNEHILGSDLYKSGLEQAKSFNIKIFEEQVLHIEVNFDNDNLLVTTNKNTYETKTLIMATGKKRTMLKIEGFQNLTRGVSYCATCDGFFYKKKEIAIVGNKDFAIHEYEYLENIAAKTHLLTNGLETTMQNGNINTHKIKKFENVDTKVKITFDDDTELLLDGIFVALGDASSSDFAKQLGVELDTNDNIIINDKCKTNYENIFACGDNTGGIAQIAKAVYQGMLAGMSAGSYIVANKNK